MCSQGLFAFFYSLPLGGPGWVFGGAGGRLPGWVSKTGRATQTSKLIIKWILILIEC